MLYLNLICHIGGAVLLGYQYGWQTGLGVAMIALFVKEKEGRKWNK